MSRALLVPQRGVTELILVRHGQAVRLGAEASRREPDPPLSEIGARQARLTAAALTDQAVAAVHASDLVRARDSATPIAAAHGCEPVLHPELREFVAFDAVPDGEPVADWVSPALMAGMRERFVRERRWDCFPLSEPARAFRNRVASVVEAILAAHTGERIVVVCHGGVINAYLAHLWDIAPDVVFHPAHGSISRVVAHGDRRAVWTLNDFHHLAAAGPDHLTY
jgi:broad specificity phosphatase PhoE